MKIGLFTDTFLPVINGVGRVVYDYAMNLSQRGHEVHVVAPGDSMDGNSFPFICDYYKAIKNPFVPRYNTGIPFLDSQYRKRIEQVDFDILHTHSLGIAGEEAIRIAKKRNIPVVGSFHTDYYQATYNTTGSVFLSNIAKKSALKCCNKCTEVWPVSKQALATLRSYGYNGKAMVVRNGTRKPKGKEEDYLRRVYGIEKSIPVLGYVGEINIKNKNLRLLFDMLSNLRNAGFAFCFFFIGSGKDVEELKKITKKHDDVLHINNVTDLRVLDNIYRSLDLLIFPSVVDTVGLVVYEAASNGTPALVINGSSICESIKDNVNGFICSNDSYDMSNKLRAIINNKEKIKETGRNALLTIPFYWQSAMDYIEEEYCRMISNNL